MPYDDPDPGDPMILVGVALPSGPAAAADMACVFAEEFARSGLAGPQILALFRSPYYAGAHQAWRTLGDSTIRSIVEETVAVWGRLRPVDRVAAGDPPEAAEEETHE
jgi:hypothetical protein